MISLKGQGGEKKARQSFYYSRKFRIYRPFVELKIVFFFFLCFVGKYNFEVYCL